jgi:hypothetical protein
MNKTQREVELRLMQQDELIQYCIELESMLDAECKMVRELMKRLEETK